MFPLFEEWAADNMQTVHPSNLIMSLDEPGIGSSVGPLNENFVCFEQWFQEDDRSDYYEEL